MRKWLASCLIVMLLVAGCSKRDEAGEKADKQKETVEVGKEVKTDEQFPFNFPLTGVGTEKQPERRAVAVVVNNHPQARPQSGLHKADVVYEVLAEGDITRFLAIFQSEKPENIGPVRSARDYFIELAEGFDGLFIAHGYSPEAKEMLDNGDIDNLNGMVYDGTLFKRASFRKAPHNSYISFESVVKGAEKKQYSMDQTPKSYKFLTAKESESIKGEEANTVSVRYSSNNMFNVQYEYDSEAGKYKRFSNDEQTIDLESKTPVLLDNILILETDHAVMDESGHKEIDLESGGSAYLLQKGTWREVNWENVDGRIVPTSNGNEVELVRGKTWVNIIPTDPGLEQAVEINSESN